ncbi:MAG: hypothetical protein DWQ08_11305 [Proteobacteria bacterium]|nr:MAG: hypothetical protein DWQ08_11305 [Pseudomonadota bacterium]
MHAGFINGVVEVCNGRRDPEELETVLQAAAHNGWDDVVAATRKIVSGSRDAGILEGLDDEDAAIVEAILSGLQNPETLPARDLQPDAQHAAPGLATIIHSASRGDSDALRALGSMGEQMTEAGGDMAHLAAVLRPLLNGERNIDDLGRHMGPRARQLLTSIVDELRRREPQ